MARPLPLSPWSPLCLARVRKQPDGFRAAVVGTPHCVLWSPEVCGEPQAGPGRTLSVSFVSREWRCVDRSEAQAPSALTKDKNTSVNPLPGAGPGEPQASIFIAAWVWLLKLTWT